MKALFFSVSVLTLACTAAVAQPLPQPSAPTPPIPAARDIPYPGTLKLSVDATDLQRKIFDIRETIPVAKAGKFTIYYPQWVPGGHSPRNDLDKMAGLVITANGKRLAWTRDPVEVFAFHVDVPAGVSELQLSYQFLSPVEAKVGRQVMTPDIVNVQWLQMGFYPAGYFTRQIPVEASVKLPEGFKFATALETASTDGQTTTFKVTPFETLVDLAACPPAAISSRSTWIRTARPVCV